MSILNRDVFNEYNLNYDPVGLRNISLPDSFFTKAYAPELSLEDLQERQNRNALDKVGLMALDDAGLTLPNYETFAQKAKPGLNIDFAKQLGSSALGLITGNPFIGLLARGIGALGDRLSLPGVRGGVDLRGDTGFDTFRRSTSLADFFQRRRDKKAREEAARIGAAKQKAIIAGQQVDTGGGPGSRPGGFGEGAGDFSPSDPTATEGSF
tara:strand:- start:43 stop:672 length:630 start_codon:yes stop_codon:yes gene_type:complete